MDITQEIIKNLKELESIFSNDPLGVILVSLTLLLLIVIALGTGRRKKILPEIIPLPEYEDYLERNFDWMYETIGANYSLSLKVMINKSTYIQAREKLREGTPNKIKMYTLQDYFDVARFEILHDIFGAHSDEIKQVGDYMARLANEELLSDYELANLIISFVHENPIRYAYDEDSTGFPEYFRFPVETITDKVGDCDCKAILACALYKYLGYEVAFLILPGHAAVAIGFDQELPFTNLNYQGMHWYYTESTGDNWIPGQLPEGIYWEDVNFMRL